MIFNFKKTTKNPTIESILKIDEGYRNGVYKDSLGYWTIGVGHFIGRDLEKLTLPDEVIDLLLDMELKEVESDIQSLFKRKPGGWTKAREDALKSMRFNLGKSGFVKFKNTLKHVKAGNWKLSAESARDSLWFKQVKSRGERLCYMLETGEYHKDYL